MKKIFLTAIAVIAFSGVSMANTVEVKVQTVVIEITKSKSTDSNKPPEAGWYNVECTNGAKFTGYYNGSGGLYTWASAQCINLAPKKKEVSAIQE